MLREVLENRTTSLAFSFSRDKVAHVRLREIIGSVYVKELCVVEGVSQCWVCLAGLVVSKMLVPFCSRSR